MVVTNNMNHGSYVQALIEQEAKVVYLQDVQQWTKVLLCHSAPWQHLRIESRSCAWWPEASVPKSRSPSFICTFVCMHVCVYVCMQVKIDG